MNNEYAAGLIDGEGWIGISHTKANTYAVRVQVAMVTKGTPVLLRLQRQFGGRMSTRPPETERNAPKDVWVVDGREAAAFLEKIRPHLILKGQQADCALELWAKILESRALKGRFHWDDSLRRHAHYLMLRVQELNARGPEAPPPTLPDDVPTAVYRWGWWWEPEDSLFGPVEFEGKFPMNGRMISGHVYERPPVPTSSPSDEIPDQIEHL